jgi:hypothetical protein
MQTASQAARRFFATGRMSTSAGIPNRSCNRRIIASVKGLAPRNTS